MSSTFYPENGQGKFFDEHGNGAMYWGFEKLNQLWPISKRLNALNPILTARALKKVRKFVLEVLQCLY